MNIDRSWRRRLTAGLVAVALASVLTVVAWQGAKGYVRSVLRRAPLALGFSSGRPGGSDADLAGIFARTDRLPDWVVYPALIEAARRGPYGNGVQSEAHVALRVIQIRAFGGCRALLASRSGDLPDSARPVPGAARWVALLPRQFVEDLYAVGHPQPAGEAPRIERDDSGRAVLVGDVLSLPISVGGDRLVRVLEPDEPRWREPVPRQQVAAAHARLRIWSTSSSGR